MTLDDAGPDATDGRTDDDRDDQHQRRGRHADVRTKGQHRKTQHEHTRHADDRSDEMFRTYSVLSSERFSSPDVDNEEIIKTRKEF